MYFPSIGIRKKTFNKQFDQNVLSTWHSGCVNKAEQLKQICQFSQEFFWYYIKSNHIKIEMLAKSTNVYRSCRQKYNSMTLWNKIHYYLGRLRQFHGFQAVFPCNSALFAWNTFILYYTRFLFFLLLHSCSFRYITSTYRQIAFNRKTETLWNTQVVTSGLN